MAVLGHSHLIVLTAAVAAVVAWLCAEGDFAAAARDQSAGH